MRRKLLSVLFAVSLVGGVLTAFPQAAHAATFTVNSTEDQADADTTDGDCDTEDPVGECTLRAAIQQANNLLGADTIVFEIPSSDPNVTDGVATIQPADATGPGAELPSITDPVTIDATTQNDNDPDCTDHCVELDGTDQSALSLDDGLRFEPGSVGSTLLGMVINDFTGAASEGINIADDDITIEDNYIGTDPTGMTAEPNEDEGIETDNSPTGLVIRNNVISGNTGQGIEDFASDGVLENNLIGVAADGTTALGNGEEGARIESEGDNNDITGNTVANNVSYGLVINASTGGNTVSGNAIHDNTGHGVLVTSDDNTISTNTIHDNGGDGVFVSSGLGNTITENSIFDNGGLGIDLDPDGVNANDPDDADDGAVPNNLQNFPVLTSATPNGGTTVEGELDSVASTDFTIEIFSNEVCDASGNGEGRSFLGSFTVTTDADGDATFSETVSAPPAFEDQITATATRDSTGDTSEFSECEQLGGPADLALEKTDDPDPVAPGDTLTYTIDVSNPGGEDADNVEVRDDLPAEVENPTVTNDGGFSCSISTTGDVICDGGTTVAAQQTRTIVIEVDVESGTAENTTITNNVEATGEDQNGDPISATASEDTTVSSDVPQCAGEDITIFGTSGNDTITGTSGDDVIHAGPGDDEVRGLGGNDTVCLGGGNDVANGGDGNDKILGAPGNDTLRGQAGDDVLVGGPGNDTLVGAAGNDTLRGWDGVDELRAHGGDDTLTGGQGDDELFGGVGTDELRGQGDDDTVRGNPGPDNLIGGPGSDRLLGAEGDDTLRGSGGPDAFNGGPDVDNCVDFDPAEDIGQVNCNP